MSTIINSGVIGLGVGEQHALTLARHPLSNLKYICDIDEDRAKKFKSIHQLKCGLTTFESMVVDKNVDLISIASFDADHYQQVMSCLKNDKHVFVEKPLCQSLEQLNSIITLWNKKKLGLSSNLILRCSPLFMWLLKVIESGALGDIYSFDGDYLYGRVHKITEGWRARTENYSVMEGGGIHLIDLMILLSGQKPVKVQSIANKIVTANTPFRYQDFHASTFHFESGLVGRITANFGCVHRHQHVVRLFGTKGTFIYDDMGPRIHWKRDEESKSESIDIQAKPENKGALIPEFLESILAGTADSYARREFDLMSIVLAAETALRYEKPITIEYVT
ncbi:MAG: Gfo/Idh/MocA family oxidoreductase [Alphaproteobacteria bacterium]|nr:Gfo/Idh/MocA family oxidoreductase [Alphaproteobacteria bacterium]